MLKVKMIDQIQILADELVKNEDRVVVLEVNTSTWTEAGEKQKTKNIYQQINLDVTKGEEQYIGAYHIQGEDKFNIFIKHTNKKSKTKDAITRFQISFAISDVKDINKEETDSFIYYSLETDLQIITFWIEKENN